MSVTAGPQPVTPSVVGSPRESSDVLLVDDNADLRYVLAAVLSRHGYRVI